MTQRTQAFATVLVVDRDHSLRLTARRLLESEGYLVLDACDAAAAEQLATLYVGPIHVLLVEMDVPTTGAQALSDRVRRLHPDIKVLIASDRPRRDLSSRPGSATPIVRKPFEKRRLVDDIRRVLAGPR